MPNCKFTGLTQLKDIVVGCSEKRHTLRKLHPLIKAVRLNNVTLCTDLAMNGSSMGIRELPRLFKDGIVSVTGQSSRPLSKKGYFVVSYFFQMLITFL